MLSVRISSFSNQHIVTMSTYGHSALNIRRASQVNRYPAIYVILCVSWRKMVVFPVFFPTKHRKVCFAINVLNKKTIILLNVADIA